MTKELLFSLSALAALLPVSFLALRKGHRRDGLFWLLLAVAVAGPAAWTLTQTADHWHSGLSNTLWVTITATMALFVVVAVASRQAWRLTPLLVPYMAALGVMATIWMHAPSQPVARPDLGWFWVHIVVSVATYGLVTLAGVAALAAFLQERALKRKRPNALTRSLPSITDSERLVVRLLGLGEVVLGVGLATGMALEVTETGSLLTFDHKTVLTLLAFAVIGGLLAAHVITGMRGRLAARIVLLAYLLLTLGYPGVKFVTDVLAA
ncbi:MAG: cytochrome c biogenesis protein CcsA [Rhodobacterales bacterium]|nr:cytochrome c biogenesis protein CcsA [Rhodobacterales bacterium]